LKIIGKIDMGGVFVIKISLNGLWVDRVLAWKKE
jgi:hypothetical protein